MIENFEDKMRKAVQDIDKYGQEFARLQPISNYVSDTKKPVLYAEMLKAGDVAMWKAECYGNTSEAYLTHLKGIKEAEMASLTAKAKLEAAKAKFEALRSLCSFQKTQMGAFKE